MEQKSIFAIFAFFDAHNGTFTALFSGLLAIFTLLLFCVGRRQLSQLQASITLARQEFTASHRPHLIVRNIVIRRAGSSPVHDGYLQVIAPDEVLQGQFYVANAGDTKATIREALIVFYGSQNDLPMERPYEGLDGNATPVMRVLAPGESVPILFQSPTMIGRPTAQGSLYPNAIFVPGRDIPFYAMGWVEYIDDADVSRRVSFCRRYSFEARRFVDLDKLDRDYEAGE